MEYLTLVLLNYIQALQVHKRTRLQKYTDAGKYQFYHAVIVNAAMRRKKYKSDRFPPSPFIYFYFLSLALALLVVLHASPLSFHLWPCLLKTYTWSWVIQCISPYASCLSSAKSWERADRLNERGERTVAESLTLLQKCTQPVKHGWFWQIPVWLSLSLLQRSRGNRCFSPLLLVGTKFFWVKAIKAGHCPIAFLKQTPWEYMQMKSSGYLPYYCIPIKCLWSLLRAS